MTIYAVEEMQLKDLNPNYDGVFGIEHEDGTRMLLCADLEDENGEMQYRTVYADLSGVSFKLSEFSPEKYIITFESNRVALLWLAEGEESE